MEPTCSHDGLMTIKYFVSVLITLLGGFSVVAAAVLRAGSKISIRLSDFDREQQIANALTASANEANSAEHADIARVLNRIVDHQGALRDRVGTIEGKLSAEDHGAG